MYDVWVIKASRKPYLHFRNVQKTFALEQAERLYNNWKVLHAAGLSVSGVSIQIVNSTHLDEAMAVQIGGLPSSIVKEQFGGY